MEVGKRPLTSIPGVGKSIAQDLADLGFTGVEDLRGEDPQQMYDRLCALRGCMIDRCMLYVFRCAVFLRKRKTRPRRSAGGGIGRIIRNSSFFCRKKHRTVRGL